MLTGRTVHGVSFPLSIEVDHRHQQQQQKCTAVNISGMYF